MSPLCTFASCFDLTTHAWFEPTTDQQQSFSKRVGSSRPATNAHLLETQGPRDEILPTKNVASRADFDAASSTEVFAALGSQLEHVDGISWSLRDLSSCRSEASCPERTAFSGRSPPHSKRDRGVARAAARRLPPRRGEESAFPLLTACFYSKLREKKK